MKHQFSRNELAIGQEGLDLLKNKTVAVLGIGGVGSFAAEALARTNIGHIILIDKDDVDITNVNRQIHALTSTIGQSKVTLMEERIKLINPDCKVTSLHMFYTEETYEQIFNNYHIDYFIDASDTIIYKVHLMKECLERGIDMISSMGAANKTDPTRFEIADISKTHTDPMAKVIRNRLKRQGIRKGVKVVFSDESPIVIREDEKKLLAIKMRLIVKVKCHHSSNAFVPSVVGLICASYVINDILKDIPVRRIKIKVSNLKK
ncbi:putative factor involved in sulfur-containing coenzyme synthesis [Staphylococcus capitis]|nr:putative factor involved in sulfur-containing coenzyme synthesis [Staphylococcus capitis]